MDLKESIRNILIKVLKVKPEDIQEEVSLSESLGVDSTEMVEVVIQLEKTFGIKVTSSEVNKYSNLNDIVNTVRKKLTNANNRFEPAY